MLLRASGTCQYDRREHKLLAPAPPPLPPPTAVLAEIPSDKFLFHLKKCQKGLANGTRRVEKPLLEALCRLAY
jgi:hypothetical protein